MRKRLSLDGEWEFLHAGSGNELDPVARRRIHVPSPWQAQFDDLRMKAGIGAYRRTVQVPAFMRNERMYIVFGAAFHNTRVWLNGTPAGRHEGGFLPFSFDVTESLVEGENEILVRSESPTDNPLAYPDTPFAEIPFGKQSWYGPLSGIWQSVYLEFRNRDFIERARIVADLNARTVDVVLFTNEPLAVDATVMFTIKNPQGVVIADLAVNCFSGAEEVVAAFKLPTVEAWSPDQPNVYSVIMLIYHGPMLVDRIEQTFGFRTFETRGGRFYLNGEPIYLRGALDQDYYPDTICTTPNAAFIEDQFRKAKELGLNCVRCHIKAADPIYYDVADRVGLLVWSELPNGGLSTERSRARKELLLKGMIDRDSHHPSIVIWTIINENWGIDLVHDATHRDWLKKTYLWLKAYDRTRLVVDNSPLAPSFHVQTDIADYHFYAAIPDHRHDWDDFVRALAARAPFLFSQAGDAVTSGEEPLICSEFGNWGLPNPADLANPDRSEPWWFETGHDWGDGVMYPHGMQNRFNDWSLDQVFGTLQKFVEACQWQQYRALKYQIESMRRTPEIAGYVITELTDVHWEANGLLDMRRNRRVFHDAFAEFNSSIIISASWVRVAYWDDEPIHLELHIANGEPHKLENISVEIRGPQALDVSVDPLEPGCILRIPDVVLSCETCDQPHVQRLELNLKRDASIIARNHLDLSIFPSRMRNTSAKIKIWSPDFLLRERLQALGYVIAESLDDAQLVITHEMDDNLSTYLRNGGHLLLALEHEGLLQPLFPHWQNVRIVRREGTVWRGDWASSFAWLKRKGVFAHIPGELLIDHHFDRVIPLHVITGCNLLDFQARVHAGLVVGWIHKPVAITVERAYGRGHFVATTFRLFRDQPGEDPIATLLLTSHIELALKNPETPTFDGHANGAPT